MVPEMIITVYFNLRGHNSHHQFISYRFYVLSRYLNKSPEGPPLHLSIPCQSQVTTATPLPYLGMLSGMHNGQTSQGRHESCKLPYPSPLENVRNV